jgi:hypothetical protein
MITHKLKLNYRLYKLKLKYEVIEMSKRLLLVALLSGLMISVAPIVGLAEPTDVSIVVEKEVEEKVGFFGKSKAIVMGGVEQAKVVYQNVRGVDERLIKKDALIKRYKEELKQMREEADEKRFVSGLRLAEVNGCVDTFRNFLDTQVEGK